MVVPCHPTMPVRRRRLVFTHGGDLGSWTAHGMSWDSVLTVSCWSERSRWDDRKERWRKGETRAVRSHPSSHTPTHTTPTPTLHTSLLLCY